MFVSTKSNVKLDNGNTVHAQGIRIVLCRFPIFPFIDPLGPVYYYTGYPSNTISLGALKCYVDF